MRTLTGRQKLAVFSFVIVALLLAAYPVQAQYVTATVPVGAACRSV